MSDLQQQTKESITIIKENEIRLVKQDDGNWKGFTMRGEDLLEVREIDPQTCLVKLLTHP